MDKKQFLTGADPALFPVKWESEKLKIASCPPMRTHRSARPFSRKCLTRAAAALFPGIWKVEMLALDAASVGAAAERVSRGMTGVSAVVWRGGYEDTKAASRRQEGSGERARTHPWGSGMDGVRDGEAEGQVAG